MNFDILRAIKRPFTDFNKLGIGIIFLIIPLVNIITGFLVKGYKLEVAKTASKKRFAMPKWEDWGSLFIKGLFSWFIGIIYMIPALIFILISIGKVLYSIIGQYGVNQGLSLENSISDQLIQNALLQNTAMMPLFLIGVLLALLAAYLTPIAIMKYIGKYNFKDAFDFKPVFRKAFTGKYFVAILAILVYSVVISLIVSALNLGFNAINIPYFAIALGIILNGLAGFIVLITSYTIIGEVYTKLK